MDIRSTGMEREAPGVTLAHELPTVHRHRRRATIQSRSSATPLEGLSRILARALRPLSPASASGEMATKGGTPAMTKHFPQGPDGTWKTGQRVPFDGTWADQYGIVSFHERGATFPPCIDRKGECAFRFLIEAVAAA